MNSSSDMISGFISDVELILSFERIFFTKLTLETTGGYATKRLYRAPLRDMPDEEKKDAQPGTEDEAPAGQEVNFEEEVQKFEKKKEDARTFYERRHQGEDSRGDEHVETGSNDVDAISDRVAKKLLPILQASTESALFENKLDKLTDDPEMKKVIAYHFKNTINPNMGSIDDRLEIAYAAANRKKILKTSRELTTALNNRQQVQNNSQGQSSESHQKVSDGQLSEAQIRELKSRGWNDQKIERLKKNLIRNSGR